jgi:hypothetical protein
MDDEGEIIYSTPLPGASSTPTSFPIPVPVPQPQQPLPPQPAAEKPADYVYYERRPDDLSSEARARATAAKVKLQSHYRFALETAIDLNIRCVRVCVCARAVWRARGATHIDLTAVPPGCHFLARLLNFAAMVDDGARVV